MFFEIVFLVLVISSLIAIYILKVKRNEKFVHCPNENYFFDPEHKKFDIFPSWNEQCSKYLSVIIPAYNEENRLPSMLNECLSYLEDRRKAIEFSYEIIIVNDGSKDKTTEVALSYTSKYGSDLIRVLNLEKNRGKGGAVKRGVQRARGAMILFADADGATKFSDFAKLENALLKQLNITDVNLCNDLIMNNKVIIVGSRAHLEEESRSKRNVFRTFLMYGFHFLVSFFILNDIRDTQCGFKLFTRQTARECFSNLHIERWAFDVELLFIAKKLGIPMTEIAVNWIEVDGSKITPILSWLQMGLDLIFIWAKYYFGYWTLKKKYV